MIYPFLIYGIIIWGNTYFSTLQPLLILQKKATRSITFSQFDAHSTPLFKYIRILKFSDLVNFHTSIFMHKFYNNKLPPFFSDFFTPVNQIHNYNTRLASMKSYFLDKVRTNYGLFNIRSQGAKIWNSIDNNIKLLSAYQFKKKILEILFLKY